MATLISKDTSGVFIAVGPEVELDKGRHWKRFATGTPGQFRVAVNVGPIHYQADPFTAGAWNEIDIDLQVVTGQSWQYACETNGYQVRIWNSRVIGGQTIRCVAQFRRGGKWFGMAPLALVYTNDAGQRQLIGRPVAVTPTIDNANNWITWPNAFGTGLDFRYNLSPDQFLKTVIIRAKANLPTPTIALTGLRVAVVMGVAWDSTVTASNLFAAGFSPVEIPTDDTLASSPDELIATPTLFSHNDSQARPLWFLQPPRAWDSSAEAKSLAMSWQLARKASAAFVILSAPASALNAAGVAYPVYLDTTIAEVQVSATADDARNFSATWPGDGNFNSGLTTNTNNETSALFSIFGSRWPVPITIGSTINTASISWCADGTNVGTMDSYLAAENVDSAAAYTLTTHEPYDSYLAATATVEWSEGGAWTAGTFHQSPDLSVPVQTVVNRAGWVSGNYIAIVAWSKSSVLSNNYHIIRTYDYAGNVSGPKFNCTYTPPSYPVKYHLGVMIVAVSASKPGAQTEGQLCYAEDTNLLYLWDGSAWKTVTVT